MTTFSAADIALKRHLIFRVIVSLVLTLGAILFFTRSANAKTVYEITQDDTTYTVEAKPGDIDSALDEAGVDLRATDVLSADDTGETVQVSVTHTQYATLTVDGTLSTLQLEEGDTAADVLDRLNVTMGENDLISIPLDSPVHGGDSIVVNRVEITYYDKTEYSDFDTAREPDPDSYRGTEYIKQEGVPGSTTYHHKVTVIDGGEPSDVVDSVTTTDMVTQITAYGTRVSTPWLSGLSQSKNYITNIDDERKNITLADGTTYGFSSVKDFTCTAYTSSSGKHTSTGRVASVGVVAVDPSVIPYGTRMFIVSPSGSIVYGTAVAGDCGVTGHVIDLYYNSTSSCYSFGRKTMRVYFLN